MSGSLVGLVQRARLGCPVRKAVATTLAEHADDDGTNCYPARGTLVAHTEYSESAVKRADKECEAIGVYSTKRGGGAGKSNRYTFNLPVIQALTPKWGKGGRIEKPAAAEVVKGQGKHALPSLRYVVQQDEKGFRGNPFPGENGFPENRERGPLEPEKGFPQTPDPSSTRQRPTPLASAGFSAMLERLAADHPSHVMDAFIRPVGSVLPVSQKVPDPEAFLASVAAGLGTFDQPALAAAAVKAQREWRVFPPLAQCVTWCEAAAGPSGRAANGSIAVMLDSPSGPAWAKHLKATGRAWLAQQMVDGKPYMAPSEFPPPVFAAA